MASLNDVVAGLFEETLLEGTEGTVFEMSVLLLGTLCDETEKLLEHANTASLDGAGAGLFDDTLLEGTMGAVFETSLLLLPTPCDETEELGEHESCCIAFTVIIIIYVFRASIAM